MYTRAPSLDPTSKRPFSGSVRCKTPYKNANASPPLRFNDAAMSIGPLPEETTRQLAVVGASGSPSGAEMETVFPNLPTRACSSAPASALVSMLRGPRLPFALAPIGPRGTHAPKPVGPAERKLRVERLRERARSIFEHHLYLLSVDYPYDVSVTKLPVPNQIAGVEGLRCSIGFEGRDGLPEHGFLPTCLALLFGFDRRRLSLRRDHGARPLPFLRRRARAGGLGLGPGGRLGTAVV